MVSALGGGGTTELTRVLPGKPGSRSVAGMPGNPGIVLGVVMVEVIGGPGWVVIATVPGVVLCSTATPARINAAPAANVHPHPANDMRKPDVALSHGPRTRVTADR